MVSGRYFFPKAPLLCLKRNPAWAVTSENSIGPDGRTGLGLGEGDGVVAAELDSTAAGAFEDDSLQAVNMKAR